MDKIINLMMLISKNKNFWPISIRNIDINKIAVSSTVSFGGKEFNYFICYKDAQKIRPLCIFLLKMTPYRKNVDNYLLQKYNELWENN